MKETELNNSHSWSAYCLLDPSPLSNNAGCRPRTNCAILTKEKFQIIPYTFKVKECCDLNTILDN
jgi:hypothetical protein